MNLRDTFITPPQHGNYQHHENNHQMASAAMLSVDITGTGHHATIPDNDLARIMYYLSINEYATAF
jgi:hypothetical protein